MLNLNCGSKGPDGLAEAVASICKEPDNPLVALGVGSILDPLDLLDSGVRRENSINRVRSL